jgi:hypothetical protein
MGVWYRGVQGFDAALNAVGWGVDIYITRYGRFTARIQFD